MTLIKTFLSQEWSRQHTAKLPYALPIEDGINWALTPSTKTHYACKDGVHALLSGNIFEWPGLDMVSVSHDCEFATMLPP